jgi:hypothetical protein
MRDLKKIYAKIDSQVAKNLPNQGFKVFLGPQKEFRVPGLFSEINTLIFFIATSTPFGQGQHDVAASIMDNITVVRHKNWLQSLAETTHDHPLVISPRQECNSQACKHVAITHNNSEQAVLRHNDRTPSKLSRPNFH